MIIIEITYLKGGGICQRRRKPKKNVVRNLRRKENIARIVH